MIVAAMATMPERLPYLECVVKSLRPQVDAVRVYLNNFEKIPSFLSNDEGILSSDAIGDLGDSGKFYWLNGRAGLDHSHYLTVDDDLGYPANYVSTLVEEFDARNGSAIVGIHGSTFKPTIENFVKSRDERFRFYEKLDRARSVHLLGTATTLLSRTTIALSLDDFRMRNAADLQLAIVAQKQRVPMVALARPENWITEERPWTAEGFSIWKTVKQPGNSEPQTLLARAAVKNWQLFEDPLDPIAREVSRVNDLRSLFPESGSLGNFDECVEALNSKLEDKLFFVVVGAMDGVNHDKLHKHIVRNGEWSGLLIEPLPDMFNKLKNNYAGRTNLLFEEVAITNEEGVANITRIPSENVDRECPVWADGISTLKPEIHIIGQHDNLKAYSITQPVKTTRFETLAIKHKISKIDILQIDAEGYDKEIFDQVWAANFRPSIVKIEVNYLTYVAIKELKNMLESHKYQCHFERDDLIAVRR